MSSATLPVRIEGTILVLTTGEDVEVTAKDDAANAKIKEFGFR
jgi:hypothetical protein